MASRCCFFQENTADGQLAFPLVTSFAVAGVTTASLLIAVAAVAAFLAHEPLLVLLGRRGTRAKREERSRAVAWLAMTGTMAAGAGFVGFWSLSPDTRWSLALPLLSAIFVAVAIIAEREKSAAAEVAVASAFSLLAVPICLAANASLSAALAVGIAFALVFVVGTLAARVIVLRVRGGGDPRAARSTRMTVLVLTGA
ncbi:MAG: YwiC-like family protein, partial [Vicinamibacterales bacterium]